jgi:thiol-disulfide isomerase/thioredoxin
MAAIVFAGLLLLALGSCSDEEQNPISLIGDPAPELTGNDLTGTGVDELSDLTGEPTAVVFWLNTCPHCQDSVPAIQEAWEDLEDKYNILTVGMTNEDVEGDAGFETPEAFVASIGLTLPTVDYTWQQAQAEWRVSGVPITFILSDQHLIEDVIEGDDDLVNRVGTSLNNVDLKCCGSD